MLFTIEKTLLFHIRSHVCVFILQPIWSQSVLHMSLIAIIIIIIVMFKVTNYLLDVHVYVCIHTHLGRDYE